MVSVNGSPGGSFASPSTTSRRAFILFFWSFNSNSTFKNPEQFNTIDRTEIMVAKEGKPCFLSGHFDDYAAQQSAIDLICVCNMQTKLDHTPLSGKLSVFHFELFM